MNRLSGKVALISGGARGQGREIARKFASEGADIVTFDLCDDLETAQYPGATEADLKETQQIVNELGRTCITEIADARDRSAVDSVVKRALAELGQIDIVCGNHGFAVWADFWEMTTEQWQEMLDVNLTGLFHLVQAVTPHLMERLSGCIILTSSVNGREPAKGMAHYTTSKHGVLGFMKSLALELGPYNIRVNAVLPSAINTQMGNNRTNSMWIFGRPDATEEDYLVATRNWHILRNRPSLHPSVVADGMIWLASDEAKYITGIELPVDGGHLILPGFNHEAIVE